MAKREIALVSDFDGTIANTFETPVDGFDVNGAYELAIKDTLSEEIAQKFVDNGGHHHMTPSEIISTLLPTESIERIATISRQVVGKKLEILLGQIGAKLSDGARWPRPVDGFMQTWKVADEQQTPRAVVSAGHTEFIRKWFDVFNTPFNGVVVTDETVEAMHRGMLALERAKPNPIMMDIARAGMRYDVGAPLVYAGDDNNKDRLFAENSGARFVLIEPNSIQSNWQYVQRLIEEDES